MVVYTSTTTSQSPTTTHPHHQLLFLDPERFQLGLARGGSNLCPPIDINRAINRDLQWDLDGAQEDEGREMGKALNGAGAVCQELIHELVA